MIGQAIAMRDLRPVPAMRASSVYETVGLRDDPFPSPPSAGAYVALERQVAAFSTVRDWLRSVTADAPGIAVVTGEAGAGKTRLLEQLVLAIADDDRLIGVVPGNGARRTDAHLLRAAIGALGGTPAGRTGLELTTELRGRLDAHRADPLAPVLLIDDAALTGSQLEILRGVLTRPEPAAGTTRAQLVLLGPPALPDRIARRRSLAGLVRHVVSIPPLDEAEAAALLEGRVAAVRGPEPAGPFFEAGAVAILQAAAKGNTGRLLVLARAAVREAIAAGREGVDLVTARSVADPADPDSPAAHGIAPVSPVIQTRLLLPEVSAGEEPSAGAGRRGRQR